MEITSEVLNHYIPKESSLPALYKDHGGNDSISEREILYKILFDLRKDMNDLKKVVLESTGNPTKAAQIMKDHAGLPEGIHDEIKPTHEPVDIKHQRYWEYSR